MGHCNVKHFKALRYKTKSLKIACCLCMDPHPNKRRALTSDRVSLILDPMHVANVMHVASLILQCASLHVSVPCGSSPQSFIHVDVCGQSHTDEEA